MRVATAWTRSRCSMARSRTCEARRPTTRTSPTPDRTKCGSPATRSTATTSPTRGSHSASISRGGSWGIARSRIPNCSGRRAPTGHRASPRLRTRSNTRSLGTVSPLGRIPTSPGSATGGGWSGMPDSPRTPPIRHRSNRSRRRWPRTTSGRTTISWPSGSSTPPISSATRPCCGRGLRPRRCRTCPTTPLRPHPLTTTSPTRSPCSAPAPSPCDGSWPTCRPTWSSTTTR